MFGLTLWMAKLIQKADGTLRAAQFLNRVGVSETLALEVLANKRKA